MPLGHRPLQLSIAKIHILHHSLRTVGRNNMCIATDHRPAAGPPVHTTRYRLQRYRIATGRYNGGTVNHRVGRLTVHDLHLGRTCTTTLVESPVEHVYTPRHHR